jgi:hypothetical protein
VGIEVSSRGVWAVNWPESDDGHFSSFTGELRASKTVSALPLLRLHGFDRDRFLVFLIYLYYRLTSRAGEYLWYGKGCQIKAEKKNT